MHASTDVDNTMDAGLADAEKTQPPITALRDHSPTDLFNAFPLLRDLAQQRPSEGEAPLDFLTRLRHSPTPEEAITYTAFAARPKMAVWWAYESLRILPVDHSPSDRELLERIAHWMGRPAGDTRYAIMQAALFAERRSPAVVLGLAVGWSGGQVAPNDPAPVPLQRTPRAINTAVLTSLARVDLAQRANMLGQVIDLAESLFRAY